MKIISQIRNSFTKTKLPFNNLKPNFSLNRINKRFFSSDSSNHKKSTTILAVRKNNELVMIGDGQVTQGSVLIKGTVNKIRVLNFNQTTENKIENPTNGKIIFLKKNYFFFKTDKYFFK